MVDGLARGSEPNSSMACASEPNIAHFRFSDNVDVTQALDATSSRGPRVPHPPVGSPLPDPTDRRFQFPVAAGGCC